MGKKRILLPYTFRVTVKKGRKVHFILVFDSVILKNVFLQLKIKKDSYSAPPCNICFSVLKRSNLVDVGQYVDVVVGANTSTSSSRCVSVHFF